MTNDSAGNKAQNEFDAGTVKYTSRPLTYNNTPGRLWTQWTKADGGWAHTGKQHVRNGRSEEEVMCAFDDFDFDA